MSTIETEVVEQEAPAVNVLHEAHVEVFQTIGALESELSGLDPKIKALEIEMSRATEEAKVHELLASHSELLQRQKALPFLIRGAKVRYLRQIEVEHLARTEKAKAELDVAYEAHTASILALDTAAREFEQAGKALRLAEIRKEQAERSYQQHSNEAAEANLDAHRLERGEPLVRPARFDA